MPNDNVIDITSPKPPQAEPDAAAKLVEWTPHNYDGLSLPGLPTPPGQDAPPA